METVYTTTGGDFRISQGSDKHFAVICNSTDTVCFGTDTLRKAQNFLKKACYGANVAF